MQQSSSELRETAIDNVRRDAALIGRGVFMLRFLPLMGLLPILLPAIRDLPRIDMQALRDPRLWVMMTIAIAVNLGLARCNGPSFGRCLRCILSALIATPFIIVAFGIWSLPPIELAQFKQPGPNMAPLLIIVPLMLGLLGWLMWWTLLMPVMATRRLLAARIGHGQIPYVDLMSGKAWMAASPLLPPAYGLRNAASMTFMALAVVLGVAATIAVLWLLAQPCYLEALALEFACLYVIMRLVRRSRQSSAVDVDTLLAGDQRLPVLYLRAFQDDAALMQGEWDILSTRTGGIGKSASNPTGFGRPLLSRSVGLLNTTGRLEEAVAADTRVLGPFVAIGDPNERLPQLGAARAYFDNDTWRGAIERWVDMAQLIVKVAGPTRWVRWELDTIIDRDGLGKLVLLMPPVTPGERVQRWQNMMAELSETPWGLALAKVDPVALVALRFVDGGVVSIVTGGKGRSLDYALAMRVMLSEMKGTRAG